MTTTWSPTDKSAPATLSGGNLVVSFAASNAGIRSADRVYTGKYYWENTFTTTSNAGVGICTGTVGLTTLGATTVGIQVTNGGNVFQNGGSVASLGGTVTNGWIACIALDATNGKAWFRNGAAGNWNGSASANPATGVGGLDLSAWESPGLTGLYASANGGGGGGVVTANFGASAFTGAVPAGFTSGFPDSTTLLNTAANTQMLVEEWGAASPAAQLTQLLVEEWAGVIPPPFTSWSPGDKSAGITLSGSNLIATNVNNAICSVRALDRQITGKFYWEYTCNVFTYSADSVGVCRGDLTLPVSPANPGAGVCGVITNGNVNVDGNTQASIGTITAGTIVCVAVDGAARLIWFRRGAAGNWNGSAIANPATGTGGVSIVSLGVGVPFYPVTTLGNTNDQATANFGDTAFSGTVPSGFTAGFPAGAVIPTNELATQVGAEQWASMIPPQMQATQAAIEQWTSSANLTTQMLMTQEAIEQWSTVATASAVTARQAALTVVT